MSSTFSATKSRILSNPTTLTSSNTTTIVPIKHWSQACHETVLSSNDQHHSLQLSLAGGAENGEFVYLNESVSILKNKSFLTIVKGSKIDCEEILLDIDQHSVAGCTLTDVERLIEQRSANGKSIQLRTVKSGLTKNLHQYLDARFQRESIDHKLQQTIRENLYMRTIPCTTRPPRTGEIDGQDYKFLSINEFQNLERNGQLLESGIYQGHYYGTPRPPRDISSISQNSVRRTNSADKMFDEHHRQGNRRTKTHYSTHENISGHSKDEVITCSLKKSPQGFGFTIISSGDTRSDQFLQVKDILPDGPAAREGKLQRGDILLSINDFPLIGYTHTDVLRMFQSLNVGEIIHLNVRRGYPLALALDDPQVDLISLNGVHHSSNGNHKDNGLEIIRIRKGDRGFGFTISETSSGHRIKTILDRQRCQNLCENDLLISINGQDLSDKHHTDVVDLLLKCSNDVETIFVIRRGDADVNNNLSPFNSSHHTERITQETIKLDPANSFQRFPDKARSKTPTTFITEAIREPSITNRSRTPIIATDRHSSVHHSNPSMSISTLNPTKFSPDSVYVFNSQTNLSRSAKDLRPLPSTISRSKTPGPEFGSTFASSSYRSNSSRPRSKTPTAVDFAPSLQNNSALHSNPSQYLELKVDLKLSHPNDGFGLRIIGGEEEKSQVCIGRIVPHSPADIDGRLQSGDEIVKIDGHSTLHATHDRVVQLMQKARENHHVSLTVHRQSTQEKSGRPHLSESNYGSTYRENVSTTTLNENGCHYVTLQKNDHNQSFGFVIISSQQRHGAVVGRIIPNSPADQCGQLHVNDRILAVNNVDITQMLHIDVVNLIKESGRTITLKIAPPSKNQEDLRFDDSRIAPFGVRPSSSSPATAISSPQDNHQSMRSAQSQSYLNNSERGSQRDRHRTASSSKKIYGSENFFLVELFRPTPNSSFGFSIRGGREFSIPLFILKIAENGPAAEAGQMESGDQIIEINGHSAYGMTHHEAITLIRAGGLYTRLLLRKTHAPPPSLDDVKMAMEQESLYMNNLRPSNNRI